MSRSTPSLSFDAKTHSYFVDGLEVPGVTKIIRTLGFADNYDGVDDYYRDRGTAVALAIKYHLDGILDETSVDLALVPYLTGALRFLHDHPPLQWEAEVPLYSERLNFAGTPDLVTKDFIYDWKCTKSTKPEYELQGAAYQVLVGEKTGLILPFRVVQLPGDNTYKIVSYEPTSISLWEGVMEVWRWYQKAHPRKVK